MTNILVNVDLFQSTCIGKYVLYIESDSCTYSEYERHMILRDNIPLNRDQQNAVSVFNFIRTGSAKTFGRKSWQTIPLERMLVWNICL